MAYKYVLFLLELVQDYLSKPASICPLAAWKVNVNLLF